MSSNSPGMQARLAIGTGPQTFIDNYMIEMTNFVTRTMHQPAKHDANPVLVKDRAWEVLPYIRINTPVQWDEREGLFKAWYEDMAWDYDEFMALERAQPQGGAPVVAAMDTFEKTIDNRLLYAESVDGIHWDKPELDYRALDGHKTNICLGGDQHGKVHACAVLLDPLATDDDHRFKAIYWNSRTGLEDSRIASAHSPDGRRWTEYDEPFRIAQVAERQMGDVIVLTADTVTGEYLLDTRSRAMQEPAANPKHPTVRGWGPAHYPHDPWRMAKRRVFSANSRDINNWPVLKEMLVPDNVADNLDDEFYGLVRFRVGELHVGMLNVFRRTHNTMDIHLVRSRDGFRWQRVGPGQPFIGLGPEGAWDCYMAETGAVPAFFEDEIRIFYCGANLHHDWWMYGEKEGMDVPEARPGWNGGRTGLGMATLRPEGFVSVDTTAREGVLVTRPVVADGRQLLVNAACRPTGYLDVEVVDMNDDVVPGYGRDACDSFAGDSHRHPVSWGGTSELPAQLMARGVKLRFFSRDCSLYAFRIVEGTE